MYKIYMKNNSNDLIIEDDNKNVIAKWTYNKQNPSFYDKIIEELEKNEKFGVRIGGDSIVYYDLELVEKDKKNDIYVFYMIDDTGNIIGKFKLKNNNIENL